MSPSAHTFTPDPTASPRTTADELCVTNQSLCKALAEALQALKASKLALEEETNKRAKAEEEVKSLRKTNSSLASTAQMLGAIVKHNINNINTKTTPAEAESTVLPEGKAYFQVQKASNLSNKLDTKPVVSAVGNTIHTTQSILYDVLEHQKAHYQHAQYPDESQEDLAYATPILSNELGGLHDIEMRNTFELTPKRSQGPCTLSDNVERRPIATGATRENDMLAGDNVALKSLDLQDATNRTICMPYHCHPKWAILQNKPLFDDEHELARARRLHGGHQQYAMFWQHPVRYLPASNEKNLCRTLIIDFLPLDTTLKDVLGLIRGGALESIQLFEPIGSVTDFKTARVVFHYEIPACDMYAYWQKYGLTLRGQPIRVLQLGYTYPKNRQLDEDVFTRCYTRILLIDNVNDRVTRRLPAYLNNQVKMGFVIEIGKADDGITMIEFTSVGEAAKAMRAMQTEEMFQGVVFDFDDDYCQEGSYAYESVSR